ncbi:MAG: aldehyde ferredoxin oxidoreductase N-terminal domain-containing protein [Bacteroidota bacterium]
MMAWAGRILHVDLGRRKSWTSPTSDYTDEWLGGKAIDVALLTEAGAWSVDPYGPENPLIMGTGPLTGTLAPASCRLHVAALSPATGLFGASNIGGHFPPELKYAGYDHLVIEGVSDDPVVLVIQDDRVRLEPAGEMWGMDVMSTHDALKARFGERSRSMIIGPAGENLVRYAGIRSGTFNSASRTGMGAVMGSKRLKAIVARGSGRLGIADPERFMDACVRVRKQLAESSSYRNMMDTPKTLKPLADDGYFSYGNKTGLSGPDDGVLDGSAEMLRKHRIGKAACFSCPLRCQDVIDLPETGPFGIQCDPRIELNYMAELWDPRFGWLAYVACQQMGLDTTSTGNVLGFVVESVAAGDMSLAEIAADVGLDRNASNAQVYLGLIEAIARRKGIGDTLAEGVARAADRLGPQYKPRAMHRDGLELASPEPRAYMGLALAFAASERGDYIAGFPIFEILGPEAGGAMARDVFKDAGVVGPVTDRWTFEYKELVQFYMENISTVCDILGVCRWISPTNGAPIREDAMAELLTYAVGKNYSGADLMEYACRCRDAVHEADVKCGKDRPRASLPERLYGSVEAPHRRLKGIDRGKLSEAIRRYWETRKWQ